MQIVARLLAAVLVTVPAGAVIPVAADPVITPARYFNLQGKTLRFTPQKRGYRVAVTKAKRPGQPGAKLGNPDAVYGPKFRTGAWRIALPFAFPFGGAIWREVFVNSTGSLSFGRPEADVYPERETWPDGTMLSVAGALASRAEAGHEKLICALWGLYSPNESMSAVYVSQSPRELVVTWEVERYAFFGEGYASLGKNEFEARLRPGGSIELIWHKVAEKDGIVGVFTGGDEARPLDTVEPNEDAPDARIRIRSVEAALVGTTLRVTFVMHAAVMTTVPEYRAWYYVRLKNAGGSCELGLDVGKTANAYQLGECKGTPAYRVDGNRLEVYTSLASLPGGPLRWEAEVLWQRKPDAGIRHRTIERALNIPAVDTRFKNGYRTGNIFEAFHYPHVDKSLFPQLRYIYERLPAEDDFAVVITDFRIDDLHNHQGTPGPLNTGIQGIGGRLARVPGGEIAGSKRLQLATGPIYPGPRFAEFMEDGDRRYKNYANAVGWIAHELGHRWGIALTAKDSGTGNTIALGGADGHWNPLLNTPSAIPVWKMFSDASYSQKSQMEGHVFHEIGDGLFRVEPPAWNMPSGFSALDLYIMGLIPPEEVGETFLIEDPAHVGPDAPDQLRGRKVRIRIEDVIAAAGERRPSVKDSQKEFALGIYLLHEGNRPPHGDRLRQVEAIERLVVDYFRLATGGRMRLIPRKP